MKYTTEEALSEIMRRSERVSIRRDRRACGRLSAAAGALFALLVLVIALLPERTGAAPTGTVYGAFLLSREAGGVVLAAVIAFALGVVITLLCVKRKKKTPCQSERSAAEAEELPSNRR